MSKYDQAAINAVELFHQGVIDTPVRHGTWLLQNCSVRDHGTEKGCPKNAF